MQEEPAVIYVAVNIGPICVLPAGEGLWTTSASTPLWPKGIAHIYVTQRNRTRIWIAPLQFCNRLRFWRGWAATGSGARGERIASCRGVRQTLALFPYLRSIPNWPTIEAAVLLSHV